VVVTGDTKVVEQGKGDGVFITTTGVGALPAGRDIGRRAARPGDVVLLSGRIGDHGMAIMAQRESLAFDSEIVSDSAALNGLVETLYAAVPAEAVRVLRDPTRGGLATTLNEIATPVRRRHDARRGGDPGEAGGRGRLRVPRPRPALRRQRGQAGGASARRSTPTRCSP
jgi:hydrogenase maturation factor